MIARLLEQVKPTLVVFSGDMIDGRMCSNHVASMAEVVAPCQERGIPWCFTRECSDSSARHNPPLLVINGPILAGNL